MALSNDGITKSKNEASEVNTLSKDLKTSGENLKDILHNNGNYQFFKMGTDKGASVDSDLNQTLDTVVNELVPQINNLLATIEAFLARQAEENRRRLARAALNASKASTEQAIKGAMGFINISK